MIQVFSPADIEEFRTIWREEFGEELTIDRARAEAESLLSFVYQLSTTYGRCVRKGKNVIGRSSGFDFDPNAIPHS